MRRHPYPRVDLALNKEDRRRFCWRAEKEPKFNSEQREFKMIATRRNSEFCRYHLYEQLIVYVYLPNRSLMDEEAAVWLGAGCGGAKNGKIFEACLHHDSSWAPLKKLPLHPTRPNPLLNRINRNHGGQGQGRRRSHCRKGHRPVLGSRQAPGRRRQPAS